MAIFTRGPSSKPPASEPVVPPPAGTTVDRPLEAAIARIGGELVERARKKRGGLLSAGFWSDKLMDWAMQDEAFKVQLFRFVDAFPTLTTPDEVHEHLADAMSQPGVTLPPGLGMGLKAGGVFKGALTKTITGRITSMAEKFIAGTDAASARPVLEKLWKKGMAFSVDLLGEACVSVEEAASYRRRYLDLISNLPAAAAVWPADERLERDHLGPIPRANVSIKITSLRPQVDPIAWDKAIDGLLDAIEPIVTAARANDVLINFDMEQFELKEFTLELFMRCCERFDFTAGLALQAYLRSAEDDARRLVAWSKRTGRSITVRLVKGAYWDFETILAEREGWPVPVWSRKSDTDACYERVTRLLLEGRPQTATDGGVRLALGSHNARSIAHGLALLEREGLPTNAIELQMLYGMADELKAAAVEMGLRVREYVPVGAMLPGMAYLVRRLLENTSNESWLRAGFAEGVSVDALLASPHRPAEGPDPGVTRIESAPERHELSPADPAVGDGRPFRNEPLRNFAKPRVRSEFAKAIAGATVPTLRGDANAGAEDHAVTAALAAFPAWRATEVRTRAQILVKAASALRDRRDEIAGILIRETGKVWRDADAEVCDAIDYCAFHARHAIPLFDPQRLGRFVGEFNQLVHEPRGVTAAIGPWNFPLSILTGMTTAALVAGNPVVMKPARQTQGTGRLLFDLLRTAGIPEGVLHLLADNGDSIGATLLRDPRVAVVAFTGSSTIGFDVATGDRRRTAVEAAAETGGANAVIVDTSASLDEAVLGIRRSAFGFQGQRSTACSRAIVHESRYDAFVERLCASCRGIRIGDPLDPGVSVGPIIDADAAQRVEAIIAAGRAEARLALALDLPADLPPDRVFVAPHIFVDVAPDGPLATAEVLGPVLAITKVRSFDEAIEVGNATGYRLTAAVYSRRPEHVERARRDLRVGTLFINQPTVGARVGRQPVGGFGPAAGGATRGGGEVLHAFVVPRVISENTMRSGFAPEL
ncbi:MAG: bifunctional proline dehydrogenase/L-glutamate gamma-semialdehyde dehydrogenase [Phycisphaerales bacterium]|nr:proline dehydrogenase family protein [Phycisphaerae bacterium]NNM27669.1 bifunctional proline dehydrogenase/L-glutamate gamma-semialdehyde dehydrogenase [Phycisphaerales bacterium]